MILVHALLLHHQELEEKIIELYLHQQGKDLEILL
jgi:hypothetical protein